jgi:hypothetical protein
MFSTLRKSLLGILLAVVAFSPRAEAAYAFVGSATPFFNTSAAAGGHVTYTPAAVGNTLIVVVSGNAVSTAITVSDGVNTYTLVGGSGTNPSLGLWVTTVTSVTSLTIAASGGSFGIQVFEYSGLASTPLIAGSFEGQQQAGPGVGANALTAGTASDVTTVPALLFGISANAGSLAGFNDAGPALGTTLSYNPRTVGWIGGASQQSALAADVRITSAGNNSVNFGSVSGNQFDTFQTIQAAFAESGPSGAALAGAASDTTSATGAVIFTPAPFAPILLNSGANLINLGTGANTGTGDSLLAAFDKLAQDFTSLNTNIAQIFPNRSVQQPTTGFTITPAQGVTLLVLKPAGTLASGTVNMPASPGDGQPFEVVTSQTITAITFPPPSGVTVESAPSTLTNAASVKWIYVASLSTWFRQN